MKRSEYIQQLKSMYTSYFNLEKDKEIAGKHFDLYGFSHIKNEKYFASKSITLWKYSQYEHCLIDTNSNNLLPDRDFLKKAVDELVELNPSHKQSYLSIIKVSSKPYSKEDIEKIQKFCFSKTFFLGLRGWCDLRLIAVDLENYRVYANKKGQPVKDNYQPERFIRAKSS